MNYTILGGFFNLPFDKGRLKKFVMWFSTKHGEYKTVKLVEKLKSVGFQYAKKAGISLGIDDLVIPPQKNQHLRKAILTTTQANQLYQRGDITGVERYQRLINTWHDSSESVKKAVIHHYRKTPLNPVFMMAFSGARGNISQVKQLVGMRGLMADPQGQIIDYPIRSNFREGLTLTEYLISSYGARKGIVDTALRTADAGYLTRRLVDVAQHVIVSNWDCGTQRGIYITSRAVGRVLASDFYLKPKSLLYPRNSEVTRNMAKNLGTRVFIRSPLTCETYLSVCQLCYGWSLAQASLVSIGEAVGVVAAQSIGEPGTQLTMRTFHTGGVFSGDMLDMIRAPFRGTVAYVDPIPGTLIRTPEGRIHFLTKTKGVLTLVNKKKKSVKYLLPAYTLLYQKNGQTVHKKEVIACVSSFNKRNATDVAEYTIRSEKEGLFYLENSFLHKGPVALTWGKAWLLSGRIHPTTSLHPGDLITRQQSSTKAIQPPRPSLLPYKNVYSAARTAAFFFGTLNVYSVKSIYNTTFSSPHAHVSAPILVYIHYNTDIGLFCKTTKKALTYRRKEVPDIVGEIVAKTENCMVLTKEDLFCTSGSGQRLLLGSFSAQEPGQLVHYNKHKVTYRHAQPIYISKKAILHKKLNSFVENNTPVITLQYQRLITGDIVQGIPKIEQLFEARGNLSTVLAAVFKRTCQKYPYPVADRRSIYYIQQMLVDNVQRVYQSQGVTIADKHLEVIVKQMTSKVRILKRASFCFFPGELVDRHIVEKINLSIKNTIVYEPVVLGISQASLRVNSFLSASSFQHTTVVLSKAAITGQKDFLRGLKENVMLGLLIPAGTGLSFQ